MLHEEGAEEPGGQPAGSNAPEPKRKSLALQSIILAIIVGFGSALIFLQHRLYPAPTPYDEMVHRLHGNMLAYDVAKAMGEPHTVLFEIDEKGRVFDLWGYRKSGAGGDLMLRFRRESGLNGTENTVLDEWCFHNECHGYLYWITH